MSEVEKILSHFNAAFVKEKRERPFEHKLICVAGKNSYYALDGAASLLCGEAISHPTSISHFEFMGIPIYQSLSIDEGFIFASLESL